ncbi:hypothetical protein [Cytobacillus praedii]|uniref:hypothetical protein n=1 Tax=Cytobacillus praedii TaxID=1742358 RepID=UPI002E1F4CA5|nr:hypothetical protein [Cytobacillus praedii]
MKQFKKTVRLEEQQNQMVEEYMKQHDCDTSKAMRGLLNELATLRKEIKIEN